MMIKALLQLWPTDPVAVGTGPITAMYWSIIETSIKTEPAEWAVHSQWAINPKRNIAIYIAQGADGLFVDTNGPERGGEQKPSPWWCKRLFAAIEGLKTARLVERFRDQGQDYSAEGIAQWLIARSVRMRPFDAGLSAELETIAVAIKDGELRPNGRHADEPILKEKTT